MKKRSLLLCVWMMGLFLSAAGQNKYPTTFKPALLEPREGEFLLSAGPVIAVAGTDPEVRRLAEELAMQIGRVSGKDTKVFAGNFRVKDGINLVMSKGPKLGASGYYLEITPKRIVLTAEQPKGFYYGIQSLMQLMPAEIHGSARANGIKWSIPCCYIEDQLKLTKTE